MKNRTALRARTVAGLAVVALSGTLALAGCSSDDSSGAASTPTSSSAQSTADPADVAALAKVTVTGTEGKKPTVKLPSTPFTVSGSVARVISKGDGAVIKENQQLSLNEVAIQGTDGTALGDTYSGSPESVLYTPSSFPTELAAAFDGATVGTRILFATTNSSADSTAAPATYVYVMEIAGAKDIPTKASGTAVTPKAGLPTVKVASDGTPTITIPKGYKPTDKLVSQTLIKGTGKKVAATDTLTVQYTGVLTDGTKFDSSWDRGTPASFSLSQVVQGWTKGLTGQTVGSQVLLVIPPSLGYGDQASGSIPANSTLVFVVDILDAESAS